MPQFVSDLHSALMTLPNSFALLARTNWLVLRHMARNWKAELVYLSATYALAATMFHLPPLD
jgi:hypothetical protein